MIVIHGKLLEHVTDAYKRYLRGDSSTSLRRDALPHRDASSKNPFREGPTLSLGSAPAAGPVLRSQVVHFHHGAYREQ